MDTAALKYTKNHEWVKLEGTKAKIGITDHAQQAMGDVVFVELPAAGDSLEAGAALGVVESVKAVSDIYAPVSGTVSAVNEALLDAPEILNQDPYDAGWLLELDLTAGTEDESLMNEAQYQQFLLEEEQK